MESSGHPGGLGCQFLPPLQSIDVSCVTDNDIWNIFAWMASSPVQKIGQLSHDPSNHADPMPLVTHWGSAADQGANDYLMLYSGLRRKMRIIRTGRTRRLGNTSMKLDKPSSKMYGFGTGPIGLPGSQGQVSVVMAPSGNIHLSWDDEDRSVV